MRIIAGKWRSRRLQRPESTLTRPFPDRVKEAVFSGLGVRFGTPGALPALRVADLFAGSGSLGLEALSRGAAYCRFVEHDSQALVALRANIAALNASASSEVVEGDAWQFGAPPLDSASIDLVFLDPPYRDAQDPSPGGRVAGLLRRLAMSRHAQIVVVHHPAAVCFVGDPLEGWGVADARTLGSNGVTMFTR